MGNLSDACPAMKTIFICSPAVVIPIYRKPLWEICCLYECTRTHAHGLTNQNRNSNKDLLIWKKYNRLPWSIDYAALQFARCQSYYMDSCIGFCRVSFGVVSGLGTNAGLTNTLFLTMLPLGDPLEPDGLWVFSPEGLEGEERDPMSVNP